MHFRPSGTVTSPRSQEHGQIQSRRKPTGGEKNLSKRGIVLRTGRGRYRITRMHPQLVARRNGLWDRLRERNGRLEQARTR